MTGRVELTLAKAMEKNHSRPHRVSALLSCVLEAIDSKKVTQKLIQSLATGIRDQLVIKIVAFRLGRPQWFSARCKSCDAPFDFEVDFVKWPYKPPGKGFPVVEVKLGKKKIKFESPNGLFEEQIAQKRLKGKAAVRGLINLCSLEKGLRAKVLSAKDFDRVDKALEKISPECGSEIFTHCPECRAPANLTIDPLLLAYKPSAAIFKEVHLIASHYHWSEKVILDLSEARRSRYITLISPAGDSSSRIGRVA
ncbi:MAG: hypothetical protein V3R64_08670 [Sphingomonadales bacterium]